MASIKDVQATREAFSSQKRASSTSKNEIYQLFLFLWVIFATLDPDPICEAGSGNGSWYPIESKSTTLVSTHFE
jgi:hypothetical protein